MCKNYIDKDEFWNNRPENLNRKESDYNRGWDDYANRICKIFEETPSADVVPRSEIEKIFDKLEKLMKLNIVYADKNYYESKLKADIDELRRTYIKKVAVPPDAIILAMDLETTVPLCCDINCAECRYKDFQGGEKDKSHCVMVKHAEALITLGWKKRELLGNTEGKAEPINCADCKHLRILNHRNILAICKKTGFDFLPFQTDTRTHTCQFAELKEAPNGSTD
ncbi:MAG: hypothetical protein J6A96_00950 [Clostridia bacterium]|nr:hypothetical protein [Clostridia bacterium]